MARDSSSQNFIQYCDAAILQLLEDQILQADALGIFMQYALECAPRPRSHVSASGYMHYFAADAYMLC